MKPEIAKGLRELLSVLPLGTTAGNRTQQGDRELTPPEVRQSLKAHDTAIDQLITDASKRRRDITELHTELLAVHATIAGLQFDDEGRLVLQPRAPDVEPSLGWFGIAALIAVGASIALHLLTMSAIAYLLLVIR